MRDRLIANAALERQMEYRIANLSSVGGINTDIALQLLDLHWMRQHHAFLLTYRPVIMRDLCASGPFSSPFLVNAIFACSSKYSSLPDIRDDPSDPSTAGRQFFRRCDELLARDSLLIRPAIPTVVGLLLLGSTFNSRGETSKGWLYTGYALRMVYDLGLHLDPQQTSTEAEDIEIRRRIFWGAFVCDKLQSLYLGRPVGLHLRDSQVSQEFYDLYEENEHLKLKSNPESASLSCMTVGNITIHSVSTFQQLCALSKIIAIIIDRFYVVGTSHSNAQSSLEQVDHALQHWRDNLPSELDFEPCLSASQTPPAPNVMLLHSLYHTLIILVHRPFISDGHLRSISQPLPSWERCTAAACRIMTIATAYRTYFGLCNGPYLLGYTIYVACTIHVRNAASQSVARPARIIRKLVDVNNVILIDHDEATAVSHTTPRFDLDMEAIMGMFPFANGLDGDLEVNSRNIPHDHVPCDPLFGLMDTSINLFTGDW
ncbi:interferon-induced GTP-binding protein Mx [Purpureocillium lavendulum]|uniref:Interferon-induced GTP-binding protein Mx n=1 Tax=Purpureocillium lavendulum TaxID=1247861 RepID=A0AB34G188_9HYPO|nr:interferon-induced GTP-binding protein Mx [Purpureocillium lavendulum]